MSILIGLTIAFGLVVVWRRRRAARARDLSGTNENKPIFQTAPPTRRMSPRKAERL
jgi:hypothetical protein